MKTKDRFSADMDRIFSLVSGLCGGDSIQSYIFDVLNVDVDYTGEDVDEWLISYKYSKPGVYHILHSLVNFDIVSLLGKKINVQESNLPEVALLIRPYASQDIIEKVYSNLFE